MSLPANALEMLLQERHSCRGFLPTPVARPVIERILSMAQRAASWCNAQPWEVHVLSAAATESARSGLLEIVGRTAASPDWAFPSQYLGASKQRRRECGLQLYEAVGVTRADPEGAERQRLENFRFFNAPHVTIITADRALGTYAGVDCGAFISTFMLAARSLGVATIAQAALASYADFWRDRLGLRDDRVVVCGISLGYEDSAHPANGFRTTRAAIDEVAFWVE